MRSPVHLFLATALALPVATFSIPSAWAQAAPPVAAPADGTAAQAVSDEADKPQGVAGIYVWDGRRRKGESRPSDVSGGTSDGDGATNVTIKSTTPEISGVVVRGAGTTYTMFGSHISLNGDSAGAVPRLGAGAVIEDGATLVVHRGDITTEGLIRPAVLVGAHGVLRVNGATLTARGGKLPAGYQPRDGVAAAQPPADLHIGGTARTVLLGAGSQSYFDHTILVANGWGALSTEDAGGPTYIEATDCTIQVGGPGYGLYLADQGRAMLTHTSINAQTYGAVMAGASAMAFDDVTVNASGNAILVRGGAADGVPTLTVKGGTLESGREAILLQGANLILSLDGATLKPWNGVLLHTVAAPGALAGAPHVVAAADREGAAVPGVTVLLTHMIVKGDIVHEDTARPMMVQMQDTILKGRIQAASLRLGPGARWVATGDSAVTLLGTIPEGGLDVATGITVTATSADGSVPKGTYKATSGGTLIVH
ncbi:MAG: hypothetical protein PW843_03765 [Azospirillaceae bacterium]|nr:hypothetical protein [Azospirillaceae bacterium]